MVISSKLSDFPIHEKFRIIDTIGVPHPYCITPKHVEVANNHHCGVLDAAAIEDAERRGAECDICRGQLCYSQHEQALLVEVNDERELKDIPELHAYLLSCKELAVKGNYAGFAFKKGDLK